MKVKGNAIPKAIHIEAFLPKPGYVEVRLTENVEQIDENLYQYDEYVLQVKEQFDLRGQIEENLADWLATGRVLETNQNASLVQDMKTALEILGVTVDE